MPDLTSNPLQLIPSETSSSADFDFLVGQWTIHNRKLTHRLANSDDWREFSARGDMHTILKGLGNVDQFITIGGETPPFEGVALRLFNPQSRLWSIHWADSVQGCLDAPLIGSFQGNRGVFYGQDMYQGQPVVIQFEWDKTQPTEPTWRQAFSGDWGRTWEWNWYMSFRRPE